VTTLAQPTLLPARLHRHLSAAAGRVNDCQVPGLRFDRAASLRVERGYTTADVQSQRDEVRRSLAARPSERILDLGSGPGLLACELAAEVGPSGKVTGVDISAEMNAIASHRIMEAGLDERVELLVGDAGSLAFPDACFDAAVSTQVLEYVEEVEVALAELRRVLRPGGRLILVDTDWDTLIWSARDQARAARIVEAWSGHAPHPNLPRSLAPTLRTSGFLVDELRAIALVNTSYNEGTFSYNLAAIIADFVRGGEALPDDDVDRWLAELTLLDQTDEYFFSLNRYLFRATRTNDEAHAVKNQMS
jgi:SAM-dependent methyltransferase